MKQAGLIKNILKDRTLLWLICAIIAARVLISIPVFVDNSRTAACYDATAFRKIALNLLDAKGFSKNSVAPFEENSTITPGYPFFLAGVFALFGDSQIIIVIIQILLNVFLLMIIYRFVKKRYTQKAATWAGIFFILDINTALFTTQLTTETLFTVLLIPSLILVLDIFEGRKVLLKSVFAGLILGIVTLIRPIALYIGAPLLLFLFLTRISWRKLAYWSIIVGMQFALITPWVIRNQDVFSESFYTTISDVNMLRYHAAPLKASLEGKSRDAAQLELEQESLSGKTWDNEAQYFRIMGAYARKYVISHPFPYGVSLIAGGLISLVYPLPMREIGAYFRGQENLPSVNVAQSVMVESLKGKVLYGVKVLWNKRLRYFGLPLLILFLAYALFHLLKLALGFRAYIILGLKDKAFLLFLLVGMYFLGLLGFGFSSRMRVPLEPLLITLAALGLTVGKAQKRSNPMDSSDSLGVEVNCDERGK